MNKLLYSHTFLLSNNKYYTINNNKKLYILEDAQNDYPDIPFSKHTKTMLIDDKWKLYGENHIVRMKNRFKSIDCFYN